MSWTDPSGDLRTLLADGPTDNLIKDKLLIGPINGVNTTFYTFEDRLTASGNQSVCGEPISLYLNKVEISASGITVTDQVRGQVELSFAPSGQLKLTGSYHYQQHLDSEITFYLQQGANLVAVDIVDNVPPGLQMAVMDYAGAMAHRRLAQRWQQRKSEQFMLQDEPAREEAEALIKYHQEEAKEMRSEGQQARRDFYDLRQDRGRSPFFTLLNRVPSPYTPRR
jgi:hypothetical protein